MGIEYKIRCEPSAVARFDEFIRRQPYFDSYDPEHHLYNLRIASIPKIENYPHAYASLEPDAIYFCDNLTATDSAAQIFRRLIDHALLHSERITIEEP